ncbi:uncharacterized protein LOC123450528 [Hordeum vulgare subsp. vulgare]|uniref:uncharacterized protein LOC123450528 n=1 Tax=Hordeum vulgare subsp. vulgare TaxID=112509 RepID=UPI001D1A45D4|nr:uncharacterized protein LOC123450528 [Hordeum vulgare subsp. vulgare]
MTYAESEKGKNYKTLGFRRFVPPPPPATSSSGSPPDPAASYLEFPCQPTSAASLPPALAPKTLSVHPCRPKSAAVAKELLDPELAGPAVGGNNKQLQETAMAGQELNPRHGLTRSAPSPAARDELSVCPDLPPQACFRHCRPLSSSCTSPVHRRPVVSAL